jgi:hypothetical protein
VCTVAFFLDFFFPTDDHQPLAEQTFHTVRSQAEMPSSRTSSVLSVLLIVG